MQARGIWESIWRVMSAKNLYVLIVGASLFYFTVNYSLIGASRDMITAYAFMYLLSCIMLFTSGEKIVTRTNGLFKWERKTTVLTSAAAWAVGLFATMGIMIVIFGLRHRDIVSLPQEAILPTLAQQLLIVCPVETVVFHVMIPQHLHHLFGDGKWQMLLIYISSQGIFALMHYTAYGGTVLNLLMAFFIGCILLYLAIRVRPEMAQGTHSGINILNLGLIGA